MTLVKLGYVAFGCWFKVGLAVIGVGLMTGAAVAANQSDTSGAGRVVAPSRQNAQREEVQRALTGFNYVLRSKQNGVVESVIVSGENGSGRKNRLSDPSLASAESLTAQAALSVQPNLRLREKLQGKAAIEALGVQLPAVAAAHGMTDERFKDILLNDATAWIDISGRLFYVETPPPAVAPDQASSTLSTSGTTIGTGVLDLTKTFLLHSRPGANRVIYLDFTGDSISNTAWNATFGKATFEAPAFDLNGNPEAFDDNELIRIQNIWRRVTEHFAPFDVDVTTEEPGAGVLDRSSATDQIFGTRALITGSVLDCSCGGIAYVGVFDYPSSAYKPAWIFYDKLGAGNEKYVAEAITHEVGHNLGLRHDGTGSAAYYAGHGSGATGWAPIMGVSYFKELTHWSRGEYPDANNKEDDISIMASHGAAAHADDVGDTPANAAVLEGTEAVGSFDVDHSGTIETRTDVDYFVFTTTGSDINLTIAPAGLGSDLDISASLYGVDGTVIAVSNPPDSLDVTISAHVAAGTYFLKIDGVGKPQAVSDPGYSDYGSLGQYRITGRFVKSVAQAPLAVATASTLTGTAPLNVDFSSAGSQDDGVIVAYHWNFGDGSAVSDQANPQHTFIDSGAFPVTLTITDDAGLTNSTTETIIVVPESLATSMHVDKMTMSFFTTLSGSRALVYVQVTDGSGQGVANATVIGAWTWNGDEMGSRSAITDSKGAAVFVSSRGPNYGTYTLSVTGISLDGYTYDPSKNLKSVASATR